MSVTTQTPKETMRLRLLEGFHWVDAVPDEAITVSMPGFDSDPARYMAKTQGVTRFEGWTILEALESVQEWIDALPDDAVAQYALAPKPSLLD